VPRSSAPPIIKGDYERFYRFLDDNVQWDPPAYDLWDPAELPDWLRQLEAADASYCVVSHYTPIEGFAPTFRYDVGLRPRRSIFGYTNRPVGTSLRSRSTKAEPFAYRAVDPDQIAAKSTVTLVRATSEHANFLKDIYLQRGLVHTDGNMRFFVYLDGALAGCFIYAKSTKGDTQNEIYLLSDFPVNPARRMAKLICMLATGREPISIARKHFLLPLMRVHTTAFSDKPVSMKYRGAFELRSRKEGASIGAESKKFQLSYVSTVREMSSDQIFRDWFKRYAGNPRANRADRPAQETAGQPALHDGVAV
jgi:GNAT domain-containint protein